MSEATEPGMEMRQVPAPEWAGEEPLVFELGGDLERGPREVETGVADRPLAELLPGVALRASPAAVPAVPEPVLARHLGRLARRNHNLHQGIYPLGSCTMKYNPVVDEELARLPGFADIHPYQDAGDVQGALQLMWELERLLCEITGMARISLQPAAGAHGEWTGLRMIQAYHAAHEDTHRTRVLIPDSAHGTNPASAALAGLEVVTIRSNADGTVDVADVARHLDSSVAAIMMTNPNTLGVFEKDILDVVHLNLHKTFSTPHGGGGPGSGPVGVAEALAAFLPTPTVERDGDRFLLDHDRPQSIGKVRSYYGNFGMLVRAYAYIRAYGSSISAVAENAVLNARYLQSRLRGIFPMAVASDSMHEFVATTKGSRVVGLRALDVAKRLLDYGVYAPTAYFPTTIPEALMFEPTETESMRSLDLLADVCAAIVAEAERDLDHVRGAPYLTPVSRVDEVEAARRPVLRWRRAE